MEIHCTSCPARFAIPDEKVRGRKVRISCKRCGSPIVVDGTSRASAPPASAVPGSAQAKAAAKPAAARPADTTTTLVSAQSPTGTPKSPETQPKPAAEVPKPAAAAAPKPAAAAAPKPAAAAAPPAVATAPKPAAAAAPKPAAAVAPKPAAAAAPKPAVATATKPAEPKPASAPKPLAAEPAAKKSGWREPAASSPGIGPASAPRPAGAQRPFGAGAPAPLSGPKPASGGFSPKRTMLGVAPPAAAAPLPPPPPPPPPSEEADAEPEWTVALTDEHHEEMRTGELVELYFRGSIDHETFIWADGMEDWKRPWEIPMIAAELKGRGLTPPSAEHDLSDMADAEPDHDEATIVASSARLGMPAFNKPLSSSRGPASSRGGVRGKIASIPGSSPMAPSGGMWLEPGRADDDVGFDDQTVTVDSIRAQQMLASATKGQVPQSEPPSSFNDVPTNVESVPPPPPSGLGGDVDDLLSDMDPTMAMDAGFRAEARPMSSRPPVDEEEMTAQQRAVSRDLVGSSPLYAGRPSPNEPALPAAEPNLFEGFDFAMPSAQNQPLDALGQPQPTMGAASAFQAPPLSAPLAPPALGSLATEPAKKKGRGLGCVLTLLFVGLVVAAAAGASYYLKQPPQLYEPDGRPKLPFAL